MDSFEELLVDEAFELQLLPCHFCTYRSKSVPAGPVRIPEWVPLLAL